MGHAKTAAQSTSHLLGRTCSESVMNALIHQVTLTPNVRSLELFSKAGGYCTSLYKEVSGVERKKMNRSMASISWPGMRRPLRYRCYSIAIRRRKARY
ncbi:CSS-motif domain-containing protein [Edwardsiella tarda]|uniref:CSS-motif domain-containing protein n=1 Tax=Edwardsiella tarda TaxID=636 RepID=UPI001EF9D0C5|nr:CSS-motif domain-containing protein [Edwardsiella tarda]